jgi:hypothetical protein
MAKPADVVRLPKRRGRPPISSDTRAMQIYVTNDQHAKITREANDSMRTVPGQVRWIIEQHYKKKK